MLHPGISMLLLVHCGTHKSPAFETVCDALISGRPPCKAADIHLACAASPIALSKAAAHRMGEGFTGLQAMGECPSASPKSWLSEARNAVCCPLSSRRRNIQECSFLNNTGKQVQPATLCPSPSSLYCCMSMSGCCHIYSVGFVPLHRLVGVSTIQTVKATSKIRSSMATKHHRDQLSCLIRGKIHIEPVT